MPIALTAPFNPGELDEGHTYGRFAIHHYNTDVKNKVVSVYGHFEDFIDDAWVKAELVPARIFHISGDDYDSLAALKPLSLEETLYEGIARITYAHLQAIDVRLAGAVV